MNKIQKITLWAGIIVIVAMGLFPPVKPIYRHPSPTITYRFLYEARDVRFTKLLTQWVIVSVVSGGLIYTFKDKKPKDEQKQ